MNKGSIDCRYCPECYLVLRERKTADDLRDQLSQTNAAREQAEAALGEAVGVLESVKWEAEQDEHYPILSVIGEFLAKSPAAKAGEKRLEMEAVVEAAKQGLYNHCDTAKEIKGNCMSVVCPLKALCKALTALEGVKGE